MTSNDRVDLGLKDAAGCSCCDTSALSGRAETTPVVPQAEILVQGMTCSHCVASVTEQLSALDDVQNVTIELAPSGGASTVTISSTTPLDANRVRAAVEEAGYSLAPSPG